VLSVGVLLRQETAVSDVLLRHTSDVLVTGQSVREREMRRLVLNQRHFTVPHYTTLCCVLFVHNC
jgi:hypothetical protein